MPERPVNLKPNSVGQVAVGSCVAGAVIGALQGFVGYFPHLNFIFMAAAGGLVGSAAAVPLGVALYYIAFREINIRPVMRSVAIVSGACGVLASLGFRWWTAGEGADLSAFVTPPVAVVTAAAIRAYIGYAGMASVAKSSQEPPAVAQR